MFFLITVFHIFYLLDLHPLVSSVYHHHSPCTSACHHFIPCISLLSPSLRMCIFVAITTSPVRPLSWPSSQSLHYSSQCVPFLLYLSTTNTLFSSADSEVTGASDSMYFEFTLPRCESACCFSALSTVEVLPSLHWL